MGSTREWEKRHEPTVPVSIFKREMARSSNWQGGGPHSPGERTYVGPGVHIPPRREDCRCACSALDDIGRPLHIGWCPDVDCERRPQ